MVRGGASASPAGREFEIAYVDAESGARRLAHAVRAAGRADRRKLPDTPALRRRWSRLPVGVGLRRRPGASPGDVAAARDRDPYSVSAYIVVAAVITVACVLALPDRSRSNIDDAAVYSRA